MIDAKEANQAVKRAEEMQKEAIFAMVEKYNRKAKKQLGIESF
jgi:hypothetical protein